MKKAWRGRVRKGIQTAVVIGIFAIIGIIAAIVLYSGYEGLLQGQELLSAYSTGDYDWAGSKAIYTVTTTITSKGDTAVTVKYIIYEIIDRDGNVHTANVSYDPTLGGGEGITDTGVFKVSYKVVEKISPNVQVTMTSYIVPQTTTFSPISSVSITIYYTDDVGNLFSTSGGQVSFS